MEIFVVGLQICKNIPDFKTLFFHTGILHLQFLERIIHF